MLAKLVIQQPGNHIPEKDAGFGVKIQKEVKSTQKQPSCKKNAALKSLSEKSCEIKGGGQEIAAVMLMLKTFNNGDVNAKNF